MVRAEQLVIRLDEVAKALLAILEGLHLLPGLLRVDQDCGLLDFLHLRDRLAAAEGGRLAAAEGGRLAAAEGDRLAATEGDRLRAWLRNLLNSIWHPRHDDIAPRGNDRPLEGSVREGHLLLLLLRLHLLLLLLGLQLLLLLRLQLLLLLCYYLLLRYHLLLRL